MKQLLIPVHRSHSQVEHPLFTEMIDLALSVLPNDAGPPHVKLLLEWTEPDTFFCDMSDPFVVHESVSQLEVSHLHPHVQAEPITNSQFLV